MTSTVFTCGPQHAHAAESTVRVGGQQRGRKRHYTVDMHCHILTLAAEQLVEHRPERKAIAARYDEPDFYERTGQDEIERLVREDEELARTIETSMAEWEAIERELAEAESA